MAALGALRVGPQRASLDGGGIKSRGFTFSSASLKFADVSGCATRSPVSMLEDSPVEGGRIVAQSDWNAAFHAGGG
ncbi:hypothetical protein R69888_02235 [Paraburkholderia haematera]|uniref:Uncharacterized protein n=1 Tax=Paraburkholderia haematera TaxID=2793077 RepID=A0ABM8R654_9BURK|nr:hypothetical protein R69888_02235 [Paraburkholderia haematera]